MITSRNLVRPLPLILLLAATCWSAIVNGRNVLSSPPTQAERLPPAKSVESAHRAELQGAASCASMACHNANGPKGSWRSEYTTWAAYDAHAKAYEALFDKKSSDIAKNLRDPIPAHENRLCLNCHVQPGWPDVRPGPRFSKEDGVGCECCHGAAQNWKTEHYKWSQSSPPAKEGFKDRHGMVRTEGLTARAETCVACHVGSAIADVNHDLIAAGHPRLNFEFGAYHANLPHHWRDDKDKAGRLDFEARAWVIGQLVSAKAALALLAARAEEKGSKTWPEFAEYDCFACHHDLQNESWRRRTQPGRKIGSLSWGSWYTSMLLFAAAAIRGQDDQLLRSQLADLQAEMHKPRLDRRRVAEQAKKLADKLAGLTKDFDQLRFTPDRLAELAGTIRRARQASENGSWDSATQYYLTLAALVQARKDCDRSYRDPDLEASLSAMVKQLQFPVGYDSPRDDSQSWQRKIP